MAAKKRPTPANLRVEPWKDTIAHRAMPEWERQGLHGYCAMVGVHGGLVPWPCPEAPSETDDKKGGR